MTETGAGIAIGYPEAPKEDAWLTSGYALPGIEFKVIDPATGSPVAYGEQDELCVRLVDETGMEPLGQLLNRIDRPSTGPASST